MFQVYKCKQLCMKLLVKLAYVWFWFEGEWVRLPIKTLALINHSNRVLSCWWYRCLYIAACIPGSYKSHSCEAQWALSCWVGSVQAQREQRERWLHTEVEAGTYLAKRHTSVWQKIHAPLSTMKTGYNNVAVEGMMPERGILLTFRV